MPILRSRCGGFGDKAGCDLLDLARLGLLGLSGHPGRAPAVPAGPVLSRTRLMVERLDTALDLGWVLGGRAALLGLRARGRTSANGTCRLMRARDGWLAVNLARPTDLELVPAIVAPASTIADDPWAALADAASLLPAADLAARAQLVGVPAAVLGVGLPDVDSGRPVTVTPLGAAAPARRTPVVADLSAMWAGPLCARLLGDHGCTVLKVEDTDRPDGARSGPAAFYEWLHRDASEVTVGFRDPDGLTRLHATLDAADVVIESSRPRALEHAGVLAAEWVAARPGRTWVSITGYGRASEWSNRVAFGDDSAVAGGLVAWDGADEPVFFADAVADPLTGLMAAAAAVESVRAGGGHLVDVSMAATAAWVARPGSSPVVEHPVARTARGWTVAHGPDRALIAV